jgi:hypothetical protein
VLNYIEKISLAELWKLGAWPWIDKKIKNSEHFKKCMQMAHVGTPNSEALQAQNRAAEWPWTLTMEAWRLKIESLRSCVADPDPKPDPSDPYVFGPCGSGSRFVSQNGSGSRSFYHQTKIVRKTLIPTVLTSFFYFYL